jgi:hypothetical protein
MARMGFGAILPVAGMHLVAGLLSCVRSHCASANRTSFAHMPPVLLASVFVWDNLKVTSKLFSEFKPQPGVVGTVGGSLDKSSHAVVNAAVSAPNASQPTLPTDAALTAEAINAAVSGSVLAVLGTDIGIDTPLVGAGLDSLGKLWCLGHSAPHSGWCTCMTNWNGSPECAMGWVHCMVANAFLWCCCYCGLQCMLLEVCCP